MPAINTVNRRTVLSASASLLATGASFLLLPSGYAAVLSGADERMHELGSEPRASLVQGGHHSDDEMKQCIQLCQDCHALCLQTVDHCLKLGGRHAAADHIRLLLDCADMCETTAHYLLRGSSFHERICRLCADVCRQCGENCGQLAGDDELLKRCAELCRRCGGSCERMASTV